MSERRLGVTLLAALAVETIGAVDPFGPGKVYLPSPRQYLATWVLWFLLGLLAGFGERAARLAGRFAGLVVLTMMVVGPFGTKTIGFVTGVGRFFTVQQGGVA